MREKQVEYGRSVYVTGTCHIGETWENKSEMRIKYETRKWEAVRDRTAENKPALAYICLSI